VPSSPMSEGAARGPVDVALFLPCYVDLFAADVGFATVEVLERAGCRVHVDLDQTCCGQPFLNAGEVDRGRSLGRHYIDVFEGFDEIVTLSGSCAATVRRQLPLLVPGSRAEDVAGKTSEFCEFLVGQGVASRPLGSFPERVGLHLSCHALRDLRLGTPSETREPARIDPAESLLSSIDGLELVDLVRRDECCGFGGFFSIEEEAVSCRMGLDRLADHQAARAEVITSMDTSCLLHLDGLARKNGFHFRTMHVAEILAISLGHATEAREAAKRADHVEEKGDARADGPR
jgi:L-lactate dehydrogenase complex protein LldE